VTVLVATRSLDEDPTEISKSPASTTQRLNWVDQNANAGSSRRTIDCVVVSDWGAVHDRVAALPERRDLCGLHFAMTSTRGSSSSGSIAGECAAPARAATEAATAGRCH
jgi:hypothetical protein